MSCDSMSKCQPGSPLETVSVVLLGAGVLLKIASTWQVPFRLPEGKQVHIMKHMFVQRVKAWSAILISSQNGGNPSKIQIPKCQPEPTLQTGLFEDGSLRPTAVLNLFCTHLSIAEWQRLVPNTSNFKQTGHKEALT